MTNNSVTTETPLQKFVALIYTVYSDLDELDYTDNKSAEYNEYVDSANTAITELYILVKNSNLDSLLLSRINTDSK